MHARRRPRAAARRGIAPLELVMSTPFLAGAFAMTLSVGALTLARSTSTISARHAVWKTRSVTQNGADLKNPNKRTTRPYEVLSALDPMAGAVYGEKEASVRLYAGFGQRSARGRASVLTNTWDSKALAADGRGDFSNSGPHIGVLTRLAGAAVAGALADLSGVTNLSSANNARDPDADRQINDAEDKKKEQEEAQQKEIDRLTAEREEARRKRDAHLETKRGYEDARREVREDIADLDERIAEADPPDPALEQERQRLVERDSELSGKIDDEQRAANKQQQIMNEKQREIDQYEKYRNEGANNESLLGGELSDDQIQDLQKKRRQRNG